MGKSKRTDVVVAGAGPVGMLTALCLRKQGLNVEIFDSLPRSSTHSYALALHPESLALFEKLGLFDRLKERMHPMGKIAIHRGRDQVAGVELSAIAGMEHPYVAVVPQRDLEETLIEGLWDAGISVNWNHRVSSVEDVGRRVTVVASELEERTLGYAIGHTEQFVKRDHTFEAEFLVGADGHDSFVRRSLDIKFPQMGPAQKFAVFEFKGNALDDDSMQIFIGRKDEITVRWPIGGNTWRWSFEVPDNFEIEEARRRKDPDVVQFVDSMAYPVLDASHLKELISERAPWCSTGIDNLYWRLLIRFEKRLVESFGKGRIWLAGDAAHLTGPVGIQSMNVGLREGYDLAERIAAVSDARSSMDVFEEYNRERLAEWQFLLGKTGRLRPLSTTPEALASLADPIRFWIPATGYGLASLAHRIGFEVEDLPVATGYVTDEVPGES